MRLLKLDAKQLAELAVANTKTRNVIIVPFCLPDRDGVFVECDHLDDAPVLERISVEDHTRFQKHREAIGTIDSKNIILASEIPDRVDGQIEIASVLEAEEPLKRTL